MNNCHLCFCICNCRWLTISYISKILSLLLQRCAKPLHLHLSVLWLPEPWSGGASGTLQCPALTWPTPGGEWAQVEGFLSWHPLSTVAPKPIYFVYCSQGVSNLRFDAMGRPKLQERQLLPALKDAPHFLLRYFCGMQFSFILIQDFLNALGFCSSDGLGSVAVWVLSVGCKLMPISFHDMLHSSE